MPRDFRAIPLSAPTATPSGCAVDISRRRNGSLAWVRPLLEAAFSWEVSKAARIRPQTFLPFFFFFYEPLTTIFTASQASITSEVTDF